MFAIFVVKANIMTEVRQTVYVVVVVNTTISKDNPSAKTVMPVNIIICTVKKNVNRVVLANLATKKNKPNVKTVWLENITI